MKDFAGEALFKKLKNTKFAQDSEDFFEKEGFKNMFDQISQALGEEVKPRILLAGKTGSGKSSLLNAIIQEKVCEVGNIPTTKENMEAIWKSSNGDIVVIDVPGFGEADASDIENLSYEENIRKLASLKAHMLIMVIKCDDRALELESRFLKNWQNNPELRELPIILTINQIDKMKPVRDWDPKTLNLKCPVKDKEKNIREFTDYVNTLKAFETYRLNDLLIPTSAGESPDDPCQYGITDLRQRIYEKLPDCARTMFARIAKLRKTEAERIIIEYASYSSAAVLLNPSIGSDALLITPFQIAMVVKLGRLHGKEITYDIARGLFAALCSSLAGRFTYQTIISFLPIIKNFVGPGLAFSFTWLVGKVVNEYFENGQAELTEEFIQKAASQYSEHEIKQQYNQH